MVKITYTTFKGCGVVSVKPNREEAARLLERLFKARIKALAQENGRIIGEVHVGYADTLTWYCEA